MVLKKVIATNVEAARTTAEEVLGTLQANGYGNSTLFAIRLRAGRGPHQRHQARQPPRPAPADPSFGRHRRAARPHHCRRRGTGFDPTAVPDPTADENLESPAGGASC